MHFQFIKVQTLAQTFTRRDKCFSLAAHWLLLLRELIAHLETRLNGYLQLLQMRVILLSTILQLKSRVCRLQLTITRTTTPAIVTNVRATLMYITISASIVQYMKISIEWCLLWQML
uniref:Uncharacterized protein n=1 Tax=Pararge aegeria TaxID=116150 RepID=S4P1L0_9NEOP